MRKFLRHFSLLSLLALSVVSLKAQNASTVNGTVKNSNTAEGLSAVSVTVKGTTTGTFTDDKGSFRINVAKTPVTLIFSSVGYSDKEVVIASITPKLEVSLTPSFVLGSEVVVAASANPSLTNSAKFVFGQQIYDNEITAYGKFGTALNYTTGELLVGAPGRINAINVDGTPSVDWGRMVQFTNPTHAPVWQPRRVQQPVVDINLLNTVFMYDRVSNAPKQYFDYFDPLQGRMLGAIAQNINYTGAIDPAAYNIGTVNNYGVHWDESRVGHIWWNTTNTRFIDPNQNDIVYASRRWGQVFPGSIIEVFQWISSSAPPINYTGPGIPYAFNSYTATSSVNEQGLFIVTYYFWVAGLVTVNQQAKKTLSTNTIAQYIANPRASGIPYIAPVNSSTIAVYNGLEYIVASDTVLYVEFDQQFTDSVVHSEYQLISNRSDGFLNDGLYQKFQDSFSGEDLQGAAVPDPFLSPSEKYGVATRPRQSMFRNRFLALQNYLGEANTVLAELPITEMRKFNLLNSSEPEPSATPPNWSAVMIVARLAASRCSWIAFAEPSRSPATTNSPSR